MHICKTFTFDAAHQLHGLPADHKCRRMHGHTYRVDLIVEGPLDHIGMIADYGELADAWQPLHDALDHRYLNDIPGLDRPTTEVLAQWIYARLSTVTLNQRTVAGTSPTGLAQVACAHVTKVRVYESSTTYCEAP